jgi:CHAT domain-containing protein
MVGELLEAIDENRSPAEINSLSAPLYNLLIRPIIDFLPASARIVVLPDKDLQAIPFSILYDDQRERYLIQERIISIAPSAAVFLQCLARDRELARHQDMGTLVIGAPAFDKTHFSQLAELPAAWTEAKRIRELYEKADNSKPFELLIGSTASKEAFMEAVPHYSTIHFAGHSIQDSNFPRYSKLIFAAPATVLSGDDFGALHAYELNHHRFSRTKLVVLAACNTASGQLKLGEGILSMARAFLAVSVPAVIASTSKVDDNASSSLFYSFHKHRLAGQDAAMALHNAQLEMLNSNSGNLSSPASWGSFILLGGSSPNLN